MSRYLTMLFVAPVILFSGILFGPTKNSHAQESDAKMIRAFVANAKVAGMCGTFKQMAAFQEATQMPGGNDFLVRFMSTEAARLGKDLRTFMQDCVDITKTHGEFMRMLEGK